MLTQCANYADGNTDLAWTRITPWRALLAAALDQSPGSVDSIEIAAQRVSPSADLLGAWLADRLQAPVTHRRADGVGIRGVRLVTPRGDIGILRDSTDDAVATLSVPGQPDRPAALRRRELPELLAEELRRLEPDEVYEATVRALHRMELSGGERGAGTRRTGKQAARR
jgi:glucose-6-phosphate dehydrogenase assembly protein OpcA